MDDKKKSRLVPLTLWNDYHPWPPIGGLRHLVSHAIEKKCTHVFVKAGGRWLVIEDAFFEWAHTSGGK